MRHSRQFSKESDIFTYKLQQACCLCADKLGKAPASQPKRNIMLPFMIHLRTKYYGAHLPRKLKCEINGLIKCDYLSLCQLYYHKYGSEMIYSCYAYFSLFQCRTQAVLLNFQHIHQPGSEPWSVCHYSCAAGPSAMQCILRCKRRVDSGSVNRAFSVHAQENWCEIDVFSPLFTT